MVTFNLYFDSRKKSKDGSGLVKLNITKDRVVSLISTEIRALPADWDAPTQRIRDTAPNARLNNLLLSRMLIDAERVYLERKIARQPCDLQSIKVAVIKQVFPDRAHKVDADNTVGAWYRKFMETKTARTRQLYEVTLRRLQAFCPEFDKLMFEDVKCAWLQNFDDFMAQTAPSANARSIHMRNLRTVFNYARRYEATQCYPFRLFKIRSQATRKRSLPVDLLREILLMDLTGSPLEIWRDMFALTFYLIGINTRDLLTAAPSQVVGGRLEYTRAKTHKPYSVLIEPEAADLIAKHRGNDHLVGVLDGDRRPLAGSNSINKGLHRLKDHINQIHGEEVLDTLSTYWARHSWATIAASLDIPKETIAAALGHSQRTVTDIYIDFDRRKVDDANRRVIDWVLYGRR